jgi:thiamine biosynthesis lipoprotein
VNPEGVSSRKVLIPELGAMPKAHQTARKYVLEGEAFATTWKVILLAAPDLSERTFAQISKRLQTKLDQVDREMSPYRADSDLTRFNTAEPGSFIELPPMLTAVMGHALDTARLSDGAFDPCLLDAVEAWGFGAKAVPEGLADVSGLTGGGWRRLTWQVDGMVKPDGVRIDLCAIAKGFAADELLRLVKAEPGCVAALVEVGGELAGWGVQPDGLPWWVEIEGADAVIALHEMAVATSGDSKRFFIHDGRVMSHTIDAATCAPTASNVSGATVLDPACWRADALATALMVMGEARALEFATRHNIPCLLRVREGDSIREALSPALEAWL